MSLSDHDHSPIVGDLRRAEAVPATSAAESDQRWFAWVDAERLSVVPLNLGAFVLVKQPIQGVRAHEKDDQQKKPSACDVPSSDSGARAPSSESNFTSLLIFPQLREHAVVFQCRRITC